MAGFDSATDHLLAELAWLDLLLAHRITWLKLTGRFTDDPFRGLYVADDQAAAMLIPDPAPGAPNESLADLARRIARARWEIDQEAAAATAKGVVLPLPALRRIFKLDGVEASILLLAAAADIELRYETLFAYAQNDVMRKRPTIDLALALFAADRRERLNRQASFTDDAPLIRNRLISLSADGEKEASTLARRLVVERRIVEALLGNDPLDGRLGSFTALMMPGDAAAGSVSPALLDRLVRAAPLWQETPTLLRFDGPADAGQRAAAEALSAHHGLRLLLVDPGHSAAQALDPLLLAQILGREAGLQQAALFIEASGVPAGAKEAARTAAICSALCAPGRLVMAALGRDAGRMQLAPSGRCLGFSFAAPGYDSRLAFWRDILHARGLDGAATPLGEALATKFGLGPVAIAEAVEAAEWDVRLEGGGVLDASHLHRAARARSRHALTRLARKIEAAYDWSDLVLPPREIQQLREICSTVVHSPTVHGNWGFDGKLGHGRALVVLFTGRSGTGKTMAASILARTLGLDLYKIDLAAVVSKYVGETEKNLDRIFDEGQTSNAVLFFDEADALFGKRSDIKDAHDRYANIEVAYLLQRVEAYEGVVVLATNLAKNIDEAFARRMRHTIEFPFPDAAHREQIWRGIFPVEAPLAEDVDFRFLAASFDISGGSIRNVALAAAFLAAEEESIIAMPHLVRAMAREMQKLGRLPARADFGGYYDLIREPRAVIS